MLDALPCGGQSVTQQRRPKNTCKPKSGEKLWSYGAKPCKIDFVDAPLRGVKANMMMIMNEVCLIWVPDRKQRNRI